MTAPENELMKDPELRKIFLDLYQPSLAKARCEISYEDLQRRGKIIDIYEDAEFQRFLKDSRKRLVDATLELEERVAKRTAGQDSRQESITQLIAERILCIAYMHLHGEAKESLMSNYDMIPDCTCCRYNLNRNPVVPGCPKSRDLFSAGNFDYQNCSHYEPLRDANSKCFQEHNQEHAKRQLDIVDKLIKEQKIRVGW